MSVSISIDKVVKKYGNDTIINGLSLDIKPGEFFTLLGPSGCGKTTLLRMIIGFNSIEGGTIKINDKIVNNIPTNKRNIGMVFQNYAIFPHMSVAKNVAFGLKNRKVARPEIEKKVDEILKIVKIDHLKDRMPARLSGGQQQRVALARAIVIQPEVLLMDEPLSNLDAKLRVEMRNAIKNIQNKIGITTVYVTHDQEEALAISDRIAVMNGGVIQQIGKPKEIYQRPANIFVSTFIGLSNILEASVKTEGCSSGKKKLVFENEGYEVYMSNLSDSVHDGQKVKVSVRPEEFDIKREGAGIAATIESSVFLGLSTHYFMRLSNGQKVEIIQSSDDQDIIPNGTKVFLNIKASRINVFEYESEHTLIEGVKQS
ncbi:MAG: Spermidine/putrescine import ATP-binding protein PotA [Eubacteriales bacterium]|jgi:iron(III) transport system ATP-binding protein